MNSTSHPKISRWGTRLTLILFFFILLLNFADQSMINPLINPLLEDFFNNTQNVFPLGWITFTFTLLSALSMIYAGLMANKYSRVKICLAGCLIYCTFSILTILTPHGQNGYIFYFITRAFNGLGIGVIIPSIFSLVGDMVKPEKRTTGFAYISLAIWLGILTGSVIPSLTVENWRIGYFALGLINLSLALALLKIKEPKRGIQEKELRSLLLEGAEYKFKLKKEDWKLWWTNRSNFWLIINFVDLIAGSMILFLIFKYVKDVHNMEGTIVNVMILTVFVFGGAGTLLFGKLGDWGFTKFKQAKVVIAMACNILPIFFFLIFLSQKFRIPDQASLSGALSTPGMPLFILSIALAILLNQGVNPNWYSTLTDVNLPEHRAAVISLASIMDIIGRAIGGLTGAFLASKLGIQSAMWFVPIFWLINIIFWIPVLKHIKTDLHNIHTKLKMRAKHLKQNLPEHEPPSG